jgi:hypothetical protein
VITFSSTSLGSPYGCGESPCQLVRTDELGCVSADTNRLENGVVGPSQSKGDGVNKVEGESFNGLWRRTFRSRRRPNYEPEA